jgi:hypothetical protein
LPELELAGVGLTGAAVGVEAALSPQAISKKEVEKSAISRKTTLLKEAGNLANIRVAILSET